MTTAVPVRRTWVLDTAVAVVFAGLTQVEIWVFRADEVSQGAQVAAMALVAVMAATLALRSTAPVPAYFVNGLAVVATTLVGVPSDVYPFSNLALLFTMATVASTQVAVLGLATGLVGVAYYFWTFGQQPLFGAFTMVLWALGWAAGRSTLARRARIAVEHERDLSVATAEARDARLALEAQRQGLAREIHDLVGHTINVMVVHAGAGRRATSPDDARRALETIEQIGRSALDELDDLLGMLGEGPAQRSPLPGVDDIPGLIGRVADAGLDVELRSDVNRGDLSGAQGVTVYRIVQEALTNTLKHAEATAALVELQRNSTEVVVTVTDDGHGARGPSGRGLAGMSSRVAVHGGSLEHGDRPEGGFRVTARLPMGGSA
ncbi:MAG: hypothetical protein KY460_02065 [Actinobacteria bacterium]|nr:hypothetical protein [Actinomycetota bacterium]